MTGRQSDVLLVGLLMLVCLASETISVRYLHVESWAAGIVCAAVAGMAFVWGAQIIYRRIK